MLKIVNTEKLIELGRGTRFGHQWSGKRCLAKTRHGTRCKNPAVSGKERCRMHGGKSTGPSTVEGKCSVVFRTAINSQEMDGDHPYQTSLRG